jgi:hypothetical protein
MLRLGLPPPQGAPISKLEHSGRKVKSRRFDFPGNIAQQGSNGSLVTKPLRMYTTQSKALQRLKRALS